MEKYRLIMADPPWTYRDQGTRLSPAYWGDQRSYQHYDTMTLADICDLGEWVKWIAEDNSLLFLWYTGPLMFDGTLPSYAAKVINAWGFTPSTIFPWVKCRWDEKKKDFVFQISGGHTLRACAEYICIAYRGKLNKVGIKSHGIPGAILAPRPKVRKGKIHSSKPERAFEIAEELVDGPYLEMFARRIRPGWNAWGDEIGNWGTSLPAMSGYRVKEGYK